MLARPELLLPLAFAVSAVLIVAALVLLVLPVISARQSKQLKHTAPSPGPAPQTQWKRVTTRHMYSGATVAALDELTRPNPARQRQARMYS